MSADDDPSGLGERMRTVTPLTGGHPNRQMDNFGWGIFLGLLVLLFPLLPFLLIVWVISKFTGRAVDRAGE